MEGLTAVYVKPGEGNAWWEGCGGSEGREEDEGGREGWEGVLVIEGCEYEEELGMEGWEWEGVPVRDGWEPGREGASDA